MQQGACMTGYGPGPGSPVRQPFFFGYVPKNLPVLMHLLWLVAFPCLVWSQHLPDSSRPAWKGNFDINLLDQVNPDTPRSPLLRQISNSAYWLPAAALVGELGYGFAANDAQSKRYGVETGVTVGIGQLMSIGLKHLFKRPRPFMSFPERIHPVNYGTGPSFPSGHTTLAFSTAASLALTRKQWTVTLPISLWAGAVGYSRMYLGRHFPTDVLGGLAVGIVSGIVGHWVTGRLYGD